MRQSKSAMRGAARPSTAAATMSNSSPARSRTSVCGYSLKMTMAVDAATSSSVRWQWRSSSTPMGTPGPTMARMRSTRSVSHDSVAIGDHRPMQAEQHRIHRHRVGEIGQDLVAERLVDPLYRGARRHGEGAQALRHAPVPRLRAVAELDHRQGEEIGAVAIGAAAHQRRLGEQPRAGRDGRERVGLGAKAGGEEMHACPSFPGRCGRRHAVNHRSLRHQTCCRKGQTCGICPALDFPWRGPSYRAL